MYKRSLLSILLIFISLGLWAQKKHTIHLLYTSDVHFGLFKQKFRGDTSVSSEKVNLAMIDQMNGLMQQHLPQDHGVGAGQRVGNAAYLVETGDIANREEPPYQRAAISWQQL